MELSVNDLRELLASMQSEVNCSITSETKRPFEVGMQIFARTVTYHVTGRIKAIVGDWATLEDAAWIADSGRFSSALEKSEFEEVEPYPRDVYLNLSTVTDITTIAKLPKVAK